MKHVINNIKSSFLNIMHIFFIYSLLLILLFLGYRIVIYRIIKSIYSELNTLTFFNYINISLYYDSITLSILLIILLIILLLFNNTKKIKYILASLFIALQALLFLLSIEFFRIYETTYQNNFMGAEHFSGITEMIISALAEFSAAFYISFVIISILIIFLTLVIYYNETKLCNIILPDSKAISTKIIMYFPLLIITACLINALLSAPDSRITKFLNKIGKSESKKMITTLHELSMNPVYNLFIAEPASPIDTGIHELEKTEFTYKLNTNSIESLKRHPKIDLIPRGKKYNIIFYFFESTPYKYLNIRINGSYVTKTVHRLFKNSIVARNHYVNYPLSANAMLTVLTSAYDMNTKDLIIQKYPDIKLKTASEILKDNGYRTCLIHTGGLGYAGQNRFLKNRKFDEIIEYKQLIKIPPYNYQVGWGVDERAMIKPSINFIKEDRNKPFFLVYLPVNPHHPYAIPHKKYQITGKIEKGIDYKKKNWLNYLNSLHYADSCLGELINKLEQEGLMENTLLFLFADHGEAFYQHVKNYNHPLFLYEENVHVPFLIYNKNIIKDTVYFDGITRHIDILPTLLDILDINPEKEQEGISFLSAHYEQLALIHTSWKDDYIGIRDGKWKYIYRTKDAWEELYNLKDDPDENSNIAFKHPDKVKKYKDFILKSRTYKAQFYERILKK